MRRVRRFWDRGEGGVGSRKESRWRRLRRGSGMEGGKLGGYSVIVVRVGACFKRGESG